MAKEFLRSVAETLFSAAGNRLKDYCIVFPNRRSALFFRKYLGETVNMPLFSPRLTTVNDLFASMSGLKVADRITLLARLYGVFTSCVAGFDEPFDDFIYRGEVLLGDFDDIDKYLVDAQALYGNISDLKEIESRYDYMTENQKKAIASFWGTVNDYRDNRNEAAFLKMWNSLYPVYDAFRKTLKDQGIAYEGMIYRDVIDRIDAGDNMVMSVLERYESIVFVGLNAPNSCERKLFDILKKSGKGNFYWDFYSDALRDPDNKSSLFMRDNIRRYPSFPPLPADTDPGSCRPEVEVVAVPSAVGQVKYVHSLLKELSASGADMFRTAILLPDENLLVPMLNSIPEAIDTVNVTMGYPLVSSEVYSFVILLANLQERMTVRPEDGPLFHYRDVLGILEHSFFKRALPEWSERIRSLIFTENRIYIPAAELAEYSMSAAVFEPVLTEAGDTPRLLTAYMKRALEAVSLHVGSIDKEFLLGCYRSFNLLDRIGLKIRKDTYFRLLGRVISAVSVPFAGEPLAGLQIMGPLEIRALDFDNLIILSVNEGTFPTGTTAASMIPYNLRKGFGLPTYEFQDSVSAYHFYRSICRAGKVWLLYDSRSGGLMSGEESRYIKQLEYIYRYDIVRRNISFSLSPVQNTTDENELYMTDEEASALLSMKFSPSSISTYLRCSRQFYYRFVRMLKEPDTVSDEVDASAFGQIYHYVMQHIYRKGEKYGHAAMEELIAKAKTSGFLSEMIKAGFEETLKIKRISGKNRIAEEMVSRLVLQTLERDAAIPGGFEMISTEESKKDYFITGSGRRVLLKGIVDRFDKLDGNVYRIVDYKTGSKHFEMRTVSELFDRDRFEAGSHIFQLYFYLLLLEMAGKIKDPHGLLLEIYYTSELFSGGKNAILSDRNDYDEFRKCLSGLLDEILDPEIPFGKTEDSRNCDYCPFLSVCGK